MQTTSRRTLAAALAVLCSLSMVAPVVAGPSATGPSAGVPAAASAQNATDEAPNPCVGTMASPANGTTVISVQGFQFGKNGGKRPAKLVGVGPSGEIRWVHQSAEKYGVVWGYDVDPMDNGNLFVTATLQNHTTLVYEFDPETQEQVWSKTFDLGDTHDADLINNGSEILLANMRNYNATAGRNDDRIFVYNRTTEQIEWEWRFDDHYDRRNLEENYTDDWTHVNDVDKIGDGLYLASPRNFDQAIVVNRSTNEIVMKLGEDGKKGILAEQHNPDYLESENGTPALLVGDSENDRIVEYANPDGDLTNGSGWTRTWTLKGDLNWPRDADRLPSGNTLVTDSSNHRVLEVTPNGTVVWEFYAPWLVYDAARIPAGEHGGPTMTDLNATGTYQLRGDTDRNRTELRQCHRVLRNVSGLADGRTPSNASDAGETTEGAMDDESSESDGSDAPGSGEETTSGDGESANNGSDATTGEGDATSDTASTGVPGFGPLAALAGLFTAFVALGVGTRRSR
ncbi:arylsulfotransferase family protein [Halorussus limi]|uniref:Arylsulfotransferase family protein n=1 Tax=Halorussus limi TaxID=2938695 RepID=A0A8U0HXD2_9EURY|nr:arylsulfotransferase family protein [Halorussus limi]UPV75391.1 arylsulfotransferase family protein [Halorussus limi]